MQYRVLGRTGERVSAVGLGGFHIGKIERRAAISLIRAAIDGGITFLDNCWDYHNGESEVRMGHALRDGYRRRVFLMTKLDAHSREMAAAQLEQSLRRLQTDCIDLVQMHEVIRPGDPDALLAPGGAIEALLAARQAGKLRYIGFTGHKDPAVHLKMLASGFPFDTVQMPLNCFDAHFRSFEAMVLPQVVARGIGVLGMKPLAGGRILESGGAGAEECLRYALSLPVSVVITGCESRAQVEQALRAGGAFTPLSAEERAALLARTAPAAADGAWERYKTTSLHDGTDRNPHWLTASVA
ncbi:MAG TPA: aldo/keto reductase [Dehalococcoidia bacterium]|nr:aldo/keto reductase [Dehalococcoidia bacterium]